MKFPAVMGIDASLTHTCMWWGDEYVSIKGGKLRGANRLHQMYTHVHTTLLSKEPHTVVIEGYAYMATNARSHRLGEIGGVIRLACAQTPSVKRIWEVPPTTLKKWFTGYGRATKWDMMEEANKRQEKWEISDDNVADAYALWCIAQDEAILRKKGSLEELTEGRQQG